MIHFESLNQGYKKAVPLAPAAQWSKVIWGEEVSIFYIILYFSVGELLLSWYGEAKYILQPCLESFL